MEPCPWSLLADAQLYHSPASALWTALLTFITEVVLWSVIFSHLHDTCSSPADARQFCCLPSQLLFWSQDVIDMWSSSLTSGFNKEEESEEETPWLTTETQTPAEKPVIQHPSSPNLPHDILMWNESVYPRRVLIAGEWPQTPHTFSKGNPLT